MSNEDSQHNFSWGTGLTIVILLFIGSTLAVVGFLFSLDYEMVTENHYQKAERYQQHINRVEHARALNDPVQITWIQKEQKVTIHFPPALENSRLKGTIELYRPNNAAMDRQIELSLDEGGSQHIPANQLSKGKWLIKVNWTLGDKRYYKQKPIFI